MRLAGKFDLAVGVLIGLIVGLAVVYLLVVGVVAGSKDASGISTTSPAPPARDATNGPAQRVAPGSPSQRR